MLDLIAKVSLYAGLGALLMAANVWFISHLASRFSDSAASVVAPFQIIGKKDEGKLGTVLAQMLIARIGRIKEEMDASARALEAARASVSGHSLRTLDQPSAKTPSFPEEIFQPLDIQLSVGGVEVGGLLSILHRVLTRDQILQISVHYAVDKATLVGNSKSPGAESLYLADLDPSHEEVIAAAAYSITQREFARRFPEAGALDWSDFQVLLETLHKMAELSHQAKLGRAHGMSYRALLPQMEMLADKMPRWATLLRLSAELAENAEDPAKAIEFYDKERKLSNTGSRAYAVLSRQIRELEEQVAARASAATLGAAPVDELENFLERLRRASVAKQLFDLLGVTSLEMTRAPVIAVLGGVPPAGTVPEDAMEVLPPIEGAEEGDPIMSNYIGTVVQTIRLIAPNARFIFQSVQGQGGGFSMEHILQSAGSLAAAKPNVLLVTLGPLPRNLFETALTDIGQSGVLSIVAAGNRGPTEPIPLAGAPVLDGLMIVSAVDMKGNKAPFSQAAEESFWVPGVQVPVIVQKDGQFKFEPRSGTTYSAAIAAAIVARILDRHPEPELGNLLNALRTGSRQVLSPDGPAVLNLDATLEALSAG